MLTGPESCNHSRKPEIVADAAYAILIKDSKTVSGNFFIDEDVLKAEGITDMKQYACNPGILIQLFWKSLDFHLKLLLCSVIINFFSDNSDNLLPDFFLGDPPPNYDSSLASKKKQDSEGRKEIFFASFFRVPAKSVVLT